MALTDNIISYWKLDESSGSTVYDSVGSNNGTIDGATYTASGKINGAYDFDGTNDYIGIPKGILGGAGAVSIAGWIKMDTYPNNTAIPDGRVIYRDRPTNILFRTSYRYISGPINRGISWGITTNNGYKEIIVGNYDYLSLNTWYHLVGVYDGSYLRLYLNGTEIGSPVSQTGTISTGTGTDTIGSDSGTALFFDGIIDELGFWSRALSPTEIEKLYNSGSGFQYPFTVETGNIKKLNGILWANLKKVNGIAVANINKINGIEAGGTAPTGWHVPTDAELTTLTDYLGTNAGSKLKASSWDGTNSSGFTALPAGYRSVGGGFNKLGSNADLWSSSEDGSGRSWLRDLGSDGSEVDSRDDSQTVGFSVRCLRSVSPSESSDADGTIYTDDYTGNDGTKYDSVKIGNQIWINENLKETKYYDGTTIPRITNNTAWKNDRAGARCEYSNNSSNESNTYGYLYNWYAVGQAKGLINEDS